MQQIAGMKDLEPYGIDILTGEACGLYLRVLCDYDSRGQEILAERFGVPDWKGGEPYNRGSKEWPHIGSVMLTNSDVAHLGVIALLRSGCKWAYEVCWKEDPSYVVQQLHKAAKGYLDARDFHKSGKGGSIVESGRAMDAAFEKLVARVEDTPALHWSARPGVIYGFTKDEEKEAVEWFDLVLSAGMTGRVYRGTGDARGGFRNQHRMSGRIE